MLGLDEVKEEMGAVNGEYSQNTLHMFMEFSKN